MEKDQMIGKMKAFMKEKFGPRLPYFFIFLAGCLVAGLFMHFK